MSVGVVTDPMFASAFRDARPTRGAKVREFIRDGKYHRSETIEFTSLSSFETPEERLVVEPISPGKSKISHSMTFKGDPTAVLLVRGYWFRYEVVAPGGLTEVQPARFGNLEIEGVKTDRGALWEVPLEVLTSHAQGTLVVSFTTKYTAPRVPTANRPPSVEGLSQFMADGKTLIREGGTTLEDTVVFKGVLHDPDGDQVRLEIELRQMTEPLSGEPTPETISTLVPSGSEVSISRGGLVPGAYRWRARAVDNRRGTGEWTEFGAPELELKRSLSTEKLVLLTYPEGWTGNPDFRVAARGHLAEAHMAQENRITVRLTIQTIHPTWVYAEQSVNRPSESARFAVSGTPHVYLLGPYAGPKDLGNVEFSEGSYFHLDAQSPTGSQASILDERNFMLWSAVALDLLVRGLFGTELPANAFDDAITTTAWGGMEIIGPMFRTIRSHCSGEVGAFGYETARGEYERAIDGLARFIVCLESVGLTSRVKEWLSKYVTQKVAEGVAKKIVQTVGDIFSVGERYVLLTELTKRTFQAPGNAWVRIEAVAKERRQ